jgi:poly(3-hydroxybutyrate) depolymerase
VEAMLALWRAAAGCSGVNDKVLETASPHIVEMLATGCQSGLAVDNVTIDDTQHAWVSTPHFVTTNAAWEFLAFHLHVSRG